MGAILDYCIEVTVDRPIYGRSENATRCKQTNN